MRKVIIIGTMHGGCTPEKELEEILEKSNPHQLFVEIVEEDIKENRINNYPPEMIYAYHWAKKNRVKVNGFDSKINILRDGLTLTEKDNQKLIEEGKILIEGCTWKDLNKEEHLKKLDKIDKWLVDPFKDEKRNLEMLKNIKKSITPNGTVLILTGSGHLKFFEEHIKNAIFPFRK